METFFYTISYILYHMYVHCICVVKYYGDIFLYYQLHIISYVCTLYMCIMHIVYFHSVCMYVVYIIYIVYIFI